MRAALLVATLLMGCTAVDDFGRFCLGGSMSAVDAGEDASERLDLAQDAPASCKEVKAENPSAVSGPQILYIEHDRLRPWVAWCDQATDGGGWTALLGPSDANDGGSSAAPGFTWRVKIVGGTFGTCPLSTEVVDVDGWKDLRTYVCGDQTVLLSLAWRNEFDAKDVMLVATIQGQQIHSLAINGRDYQADATASETDGSRCDFWNGPGQSVVPGRNQCWSLALPTSSRVFSSAITGDVLIELVAGPSGSPNNLHGTGANVSRLFVR